MIILAVAAWFALLGPLWLLTSRIYRAPLDLPAMRALESDIDRLVAPVVKVCLPATRLFPDLAEAVELAAAAELGPDIAYRLSIEDDEAKCTADHISVSVHEAEDTLYAVSETAKEVDITYTPDVVARGELPATVANVLLNHVLAAELAYFDGRPLAHHVAPYSPAYHLTFSLFYGGGEPVSWEIGAAMDRLRPLVARLNAQVANITTDSQVEYYAELGTSPRPAGDGDGYVLDKDNLSTLVNFAEWSLASTVNYQTLNFVLYIPAPPQAPLRIPDSKTNSFLIPQWGGVAIVNADTLHLDAAALEPVFDIFASQLFALLGAPALPACPALRLDMLSRMTAARALRATAASLGALARLYNHMPNIAIPQHVLTRSAAALRGVRGSLEALRASQWNFAASLAGSAYTEAEKAFFDKEMVAQEFVPDRHKLAVYMPLLGPIAVVILSGIVRLVRKPNAKLLKEIAEADAAAAEAKAAEDAAAGAGPAEKAT